MPRRETHCGYCREVGHNISGCDIYKIKLDLTLINNDLDILTRRKNPPHMKISTLNLHNYTNIKLLFEKDIPFIIRYNYIIKITDDHQNIDGNTSFILDIKEKNKKLIKEYKNELNDFEKEHNIINKNAEIYNNYRTRINYYKECCISSNYISFKELSEILKRDDYIEYIEQINAERIRRREEAQRRYNEWRQQREAQELARQAQSIDKDAIIRRTLLPILRETAIESNDCPICLETLIETNKTILRCGHILCTNCLITQTLINFKDGMCKCPVCRERII